MNDLFSRIEFDTNGGCWLWAGSITSGRFPRPIVSVGGKNKQVHRLLYERDLGPIPDGLLACHKCDTPLCVNPRHIFIGTASQNMQDMHRKGRAFHQIDPERASRLGREWQARFAERNSGESHHLSKLTAESASALKALNGVVGPTEAGRRFGVTKSAVRDVWSGRSWKNA